MSIDLHRIAAATLAFALGACGSAGPKPPPPPGEAGGDVGTVVGGAVTPPSTALPPLPPLTSVVTRTTGDNVSISFDPFDGAADYRVYVLPADGDISAAADGALTIHDATYRCAGHRLAPEASVRDDAPGNNEGMRPIIQDRDVGGYRRTAPEATLGYVSLVAGDGLAPVYALGDPAASADNSCYVMRWRESRVKTYVTSVAERDALLAQGWRDDGIAFYAPITADPSTIDVHLDDSDKDRRLYIPDGPELAMHAGATIAFHAYKATAPGRVPLMRVYYLNSCGRSHDELMATDSRFQRAYHQGEQLPLFETHWAGLTGPTTLVVEALDQTCPSPAGLLAPVDRDNEELHWLTPDTARAASPAGELYINGQGVGTHPRPIARSFVQVAPAPAPDLDWFAGFTAADGFGPFTETGCADPGNPTCFNEHRFLSAAADVMVGGNRVQDTGTTRIDRYGFAPFFGELWVGIADDGAGAKFRYAPHAQATLSSDAYLYVTMQVDSWTSDRRYPQILISDASILPMPFGANLDGGRSIILQTFISKENGTSNWPNRLSVEVCDHAGWEVNGQCPSSPDFHVIRDPSDPTGPVVKLSPGDEVAEHAAGLDQPTRLEAYVSSDRVYLFLDGKPNGCAILPPGAPTGTVDVVFGDVLYHSAAEVDSVPRYFASTGYTFESIRKFDNLGWKSGVPGPRWDETLFPCATAGEFVK